jgi:hypothetical protein
MTNFFFAIRDARFCYESRLCWAGVIEVVPYVVSSGGVALLLRGEERAAVQVQEYPHCIRITSVM